VQLGGRSGTKRLCGVCKVCSAHIKTQGTKRSRSFCFGMTMLQVEARCSSGHPSVRAVPVSPYESRQRLVNPQLQVVRVYPLKDQAPSPTLFWLTCVSTSTRLLRHSAAPYARLRIRLSLGLEVASNANSSRKRESVS
jgi:hypothetical protein